MFFTRKCPFCQSKLNQGITNYKDYFLCTNCSKNTGLTISFELINFFIPKINSIRFIFHTQKIIIYYYQYLNENSYIVIYELKNHIHYHRRFIPLSEPLTPKQFQEKIVSLILLI